jgi:hypothetical protein
MDAWGFRWLGEGGLDARFVNPVYDGDTITIRATRSGSRMKIEAVNAGGIVCATAAAERRIAEPAPDPQRWPERPLPAVLMAAPPRRWRRARSSARCE